MRYKGKVQYVRYYTAGSAAQKVTGNVPNPARAAGQPIRPQPVEQKKPKVSAHVVHPFALIGTAVAVILALCVMAGAFRFYQSGQREAAMAEYITTLKEENAALEAQYSSGYDLEEIRRTAEAMGLVPKDQVEHIRMQVKVPVPEPEPTFWETFWAELQELFA